MSKFDTIQTESKPKLALTPWLLDIGMIALIMLATIVINYKMIKDGLNGMPDIRWHITWLQHFSQELAEGIWYPRWLAGTNFGYGSPTFVFYPPLAYYLGSAIKAIGFDTQQALVAMFSLSLFSCGGNFYLYGRKRWGRLATLVGAIAFMTAPFLGYNIYFAARFAEVFALLWIPLGLWLTDKALENPRWRIPLAVFFACFALSHVPSLLLCFIFWIPYTLFQLLKKPWQTVITTIGSAFVGFGIVSLYLFPAIRERDFVNTEGMKAVLGGFRANLVGTPLTINGVFNGRIQTIFFWELGAIIFFAALCLYFHRGNSKQWQETWAWIAFVTVVALMMSYVSLPIWETSQTLQMVQFPWRMMGLFSFGLGALCSLTIKGIWQQSLALKIVFAVAIIAILFHNFHYTYKLSRSLPTINNPGRGKVANLEHLTIALEEPYTDKLIDVRPYRPLINQGYAAPDPIMGKTPVEIMKGKVTLSMENWGSYRRKFEVKAENQARLRIRTYYYPAWHLYVDGEHVPMIVPGDGTMEFTVETGSHQVELCYQWTQDFKIGVLLSILSLVALVIFSFMGKYSSVDFL